VDAEKRRAESRISEIKNPENIGVLFKKLNTNQGNKIDSFVHEVLQLT
jgi:hypothetical protein